MDQELLSSLVGAGVCVDFAQALPWVRTPGEGTVEVTDGTETAPVKLRPALKLFSGQRHPPTFELGPTPDYQAFFMMVEMAAIDGCEALEIVPTDAEFEEMYAHLALHPDGTMRHPLYPWLRSAAVLYLSLVDTSRAEFEGVIGRLAASARKWAARPGRRRYHDLLTHSLAFAV